jgi:signal transduction histidine kinase
MKLGRRLFSKYAVLIAALVAGALIASGLVGVYFSYRQNEVQSIALQQEKAYFAAWRIEQFIKDIEHQIGWTSLPRVAADALPANERRFEYLKLLRQVPAITEVSWLDAEGRERLKVSRVAMDASGLDTDRSTEASFKAAKSGKTWFGPVYFRKETEPYLTIARSAGRDGGVTVAEVNLKFVWEVISQIQVGKAGRAYVVDSSGALVAHPDISLVLKKTDLSELPQIATVRASQGSASAQQLSQFARDVHGTEVLSTYAAIPSLGWMVFVELPVSEVRAPLYSSALRTALLVLLGLILSIAASLVLARSMVRPIRTIQAGAERIGAGELSKRIEVRTGDELEHLAGQFNDMAAKLQASYAGLEHKVEERTRELTEALAEQTATSEILRVISSSPTDTQPVFDTIVANTLHLCESNFACVLLHEDGQLLGAAHTHITPEFAEYFKRGYPVNRETASGRAVLERRSIQIVDVLADPEFVVTPAHRSEGIRTVLAVPMLREDTVIGAISTWRREIRPFTERQINLLQTFAAQAVIAIENVRLFNELQARNRELTEALEHQTATSEILQVISSSPTDVQPVFDIIAERARRLCGAKYGFALRFDGEWIHLASAFGMDPCGLEAIRKWYPMRPGNHTVSARAVREGAVVQVSDVLNDPEYGPKEAAELIGFRCALGVPMMREGHVVGVISVDRSEVGPFSDKQVELLKTFAAQAVIAIENVRLFQELEARNRDLTEALEQQTATAEILRVISRSPTELQPVLQAMVETATRLCTAPTGVIYRYDGEFLRPAAFCGFTSAFIDFWQRNEVRLSRGSIVGRAALERRTIQVPDVLADPEYQMTEAQKIAGFRTVLGVPMLREDSLVGVFAMTRPEPRPFSEKQIELVTTFADQALIAIENVRLFQELQARTQELTRSVEELRALGDVGQAVSSTLDLQTVLKTIVSHVDQLSGTDGGAIYEYDEASKELHLRAVWKFDEELMKSLGMTRVRIGEGSVGRAAARREPVQIADVLCDQAYSGRMREFSIRSGFRAALAVPLLREDRLLGALVVARNTPGVFPPATVELLRTFATQSALAIQNARLFREIEDKGRQLEVANRHKSAFLANMSHELRTPLNAIIGFSEALKERMFGELNAKQGEYVEDIHSSGKHLLSLINDILDLAKIEAGRMELELAEFYLPAALSNAMTLVRERAARHGVTVECDIDPELGTFHGDERKFKQILLNLLANAVKFTPAAGTIHVAAKRNGAALELSVADTGIGIAPEDQGIIFEEFRQVGRDYTGKTEGTGLGLALTKRFVELHGGSIRVESAVGQGSTFTVTLPLSHG